MFDETNGSQVEQVDLDELDEDTFLEIYKKHQQQDQTIINYNLGDIPNILNSYTQELGEFLYHNPHHKQLFDASMNVNEPDVDLATEMLNRISGKHQKED